MSYENKVVNYLFDIIIYLLVGYKNIFRQT